VESTVEAPRLLRSPKRKTRAVKGIATRVNFAHISHYRADRRSETNDFSRLRREGRREAFDSIRSPVRRLARSNETSIIRLERATRMTAFVLLSRNLAFACRCIAMRRDTVYSAATRNLDEVDRAVGRSDISERTRSRLATSRTKQCRVCVCFSALPPRGLDVCTSVFRDFWLG